MIAVVRYVAIAAFSAMFWMTVATARLIIHGDPVSCAAPPKVLASPIVPSLAGVPLKTQADWDRPFPCTGECARFYDAPR